MATDVAVGTDKHIVRTSDRALFRDCRQRWDFNSKIRLAYEPASSAPALEFGTAIHAGLEVYYDPDFWDLNYTERTEMAVARFLTVTAEQRRIFQRHFGEDFDKLAEYDARPELGEGMLRGYAEWANQEDDFKPLYVEIEFEVPVPDPIIPHKQFQVDGLPVFYQGRIDMLVEDDEGCWIVDHKTAATFKEKEAYLMIDQQCGCVPLDSQALTPEGWKYHYELSVDDIIMGYNPTTERLEWTNVLAVHTFGDNVVGDFHLRSASVVTTGNHDWVCKNSYGHYKRQSQDFPKQNGKVVLSAQFPSKGILDISPDEAALISWVLTDGCISTHNRSFEVVIVQSKYVEEIDLLLKRLGIKHSRALRQNKSVYSSSPYVSWRISTPAARELWGRASLDLRDPTDGLIQFVLGLSSEARQDFCNVIRLAEGTENKVCQNPGLKADAFRLAFYLDGNVPGVSSSNRIFSVTSGVRDERCANWTPIADKQPVWCPETGLGNWVMRQGDVIVLTGNSYIWALQEQMGIKVEGVIYNELRKEIPHEPKVLKSGMLSVDRRQRTTAELFAKKALELGQDPEHYGEYFNWLKEQPNKYFKRQVVARSQAELKQLGINISREAWDMLTSPYIYPNPGEYKCQGCAFRAPCLAKQAGQDYDEMLQDTHLYRRIA